MRLKCIGGMANGKTVDVSSYHRSGDLIPVTATIEISVMDMLERKIPDNLTVPVHYYRIEVISTPNSKIKFLIPEKWLIEEALRYILGA